MNVVVLQRLQRERLREGTVTAALALVRDRPQARQGDAASTLPVLERQAAGLRTKLQVQTRAVLDVAEEVRGLLMEGLVERKREVEHIDAELAARRKGPAAIDLQVRRLEKEARERRADLRAVLEGDKARARALLQRLFPAGITADPVQVENDGSGAAPVKRFPTLKRWRLHAEGVLAWPLLVFDDEGPRNPANPNGRKEASPAGPRQSCPRWSSA